MFAASLAFHPLGSCSKARRSELLLRLEPVRFKMVPPIESFRLRGLPLSMMLPDSDTFFLCPVADRHGGVSDISAVGVGVDSATVSLDVLMSA